LLARDPGTFATPAPNPSFPAHDTTGTSGTLPPAGTYRVELSKDDIARGGADEAYAAGNAGPWTLTFAGDRWELRRRSPDEDCSGTLEARPEGYVRALTVHDGGCGFDYDFVWRSDEEGLTLVAVGLPFPATVQDFLNERSYSDQTWIRVH
jgi:hypothetical protein